VEKVVVGGLPYAAGKDLIIFHPENGRDIDFLRDELRVVIFQKTAVFIETFCQKHPVGLAASPSVFPYGAFERGSTRFIRFCQVGVLSFTKFVFDVT
jgi:hypothetical protein